MLTVASRKHLEWMLKRNMAASTIATRRTVLTAIEYRTGRRPLEATVDQLESVLGSRRHVPATRNVWISHMRSFYGWARDEGLIDRDPSRRLVWARTDETLPRPIAEDALAHAIAVADDTMRAWLVLGAYGGLRCCEIAQLHGEHVDLARRAIHVVRSKGGRSRVVPMHDRVAALFDEQPSGRLWQVTRNRVCCRVAQHLRRLGYPYTAHTLRHRFATVLYEATGDINVVRDLLGHSKTTTTQVYVQISVERRRAAVAMIS